ncbi:MAG TPA: PAS domain S-box protein [Opitutus sp.]|nr:PAS domain S-box protein [Opitutus sp.]
MFPPFSRRPPLDPNRRRLGVVPGIGLGLVPTTLAAAGPAASAVHGVEWLIPAIILLAAGAGAWLAGRRAGRRMQRDAEQLRSVFEFADCLLWQATVEAKGDDWTWKFTMQPTGLCRRLFEGMESPGSKGPWGQCGVVELEEMDARCRSALRRGASGYDQQFHFVRDGREVWLRESVSITRVSPGVFWLVGLVTDITPLREAERARSASEDRVKQLLARADCMLWQAHVRADGEGNFCWECFIPPSELYRQIAGDQPAPPAMPWDSAVVPEFQELKRRSRTAMLAGELDYGQEYRVVRENDVRWMHEQVTVRPLNPNEWMLEGVSVDITAQRKAEESKRASEAQLKGVVNAAEFLLWHARVFRREDGHLHWVMHVPGSSLYRRLFGRDPDGGVLLPWDTIVSAQQYQEMLAVCTTAISQGHEGYQQEVQARRGEQTFWLHEHATINAIGDGEWQLVGVVTDVTAQHRAEEARRASERTLREIVARADCLVWEGRVHVGGEKWEWDFTIHPSGLCELLYGSREAPREAGLWRNFDIPERAEMNQRCRAALGAGEPAYSQVFHIRRREGDIWLRENVSVRQVDPERFSLVGVVTDVTAQHHAEEARKASEVALWEILERADCLLWRARVVRQDGEFAWRDFELPASRLCAELLGRVPVVPTTQLWEETTVPELAQMNAHSQYALMTGAPGYDQEFRAIRGERTYWLHERVTINAVSEDEWRIVGVVTDVTARHDAQEARSRSEARLEQLLHRADCMVWQGWVTRAADGRISWNLYVPRSQLHRRIFGHDPDDTRFGWGDVGVPEHPEMERRSREAFEGGASGYEQTFHIPRIEGDIWVTEQVSIKPAGENQWEVVGVITDITARHEAEEARRKTTEQLQRILELADCMVWEANVLERAGGGLQWKTYTPRSALYRRLFGDEPGEADLNWRRLNVPEIEEVERRSIQAVRDRAAGYAHEFRAVFLNRVIWLREVVTIQALAPGRFRLVGVITDISAQREAQEAHKASEAQVEQMLTTVECLLWQARVFAMPGGGMRWVMFIPRSRLYRDIFGADPGDPPYLRWETVVDAATNAEIEGRARDALFRGAAGYEQEFRTERDGREFWLHEQTTITVVGPGEWKLVGVITDLTGRRRAEQAVRESELRYRTLFQHTPAAIAELDFSRVGRWLHGLRRRGVTDLAAAFERDEGLLFQAARRVRFVDCNSTAMTMMRASAKSDFVRRRNVLATADSLRLVRSAMLAVWEGRNTLETEIEMRDFTGAVHQMHVRWWMEMNNGRLDLRQSVMVFVDLTELKQAEAALAGEKERLAVTLRAMAEGVVTTDVNGRVQFMNPAAAALARQSAEAAIGRPVSEVCRLEKETTGEVLEVPVAKVVGDDVVADLPAQVRLKIDGGAGRLIEGCCAPIHAADSEVIGTVLVFRDVTEHERLEQELVRATKLESVGILAGGIAHDFNNILTSVMGNIALAALDVSPTSEAGRSLREAEKATLRARDLTQQLLTFAKGGEPVRTSVKLDAVVREITDFTLHGSRVRAVFDVPRNLWLADADKGQIGRVVQNLVLNAVQAMPEGGTVRIALRNEQLDGLSRPALPPGEYVQIAIADSGVGIKPEHVSRIFDPYFTTKQTGSGLGLAAVYSIVSKHRGAIDVESRLGSGTTFRIWLPASSHRAESDSDEAQPPKPPALLNGRVLFMDDEETIRVMAKILLRRFGFDVVCVADGSEAVLRYAEALAAGDPFALVIMDLTVPGGMGGREAIGKLRAIDPNVRAIVSSGYSSDPVLANYRQHGFCGMVPKPYEVNELARVLREAMGKPAREVAAAHS